MYRTLIIVSLAFLGLAGCAEKSTPESTADAVEEGGCTPPSFDVGETVELVPGVEATLLERGYGRRALAGDDVEVHYTGWLYDPDAEGNRGNQFDSSHDRNAPIPFTLGAGRVIQGWDRGVECMLIGEKRLLRIAPELGYGSRGYPGVIPPNSTLLFEVKLMSARGPDED